LKKKPSGKWRLLKIFWIDPGVFQHQYSGRYIAEGAEQKVYLKEDGKTVLKVNLGRFHTTWLDYFNRLLFHAFFFPSTKYTTVGFTEEDGRFGVITEQSFAILHLGAPRKSVEKFLSQQNFTRLKNDDYYSKSTGVKLEDLHDENVFLDEEGHLLFIDPVVYFETPDLKLGGSNIFHFPFS